jgi:hypothetical protein
MPPFGISFHIESRHAPTDRLAETLKNRDIEQHISVEIRAIRFYPAKKGNKFGTLITT